MINPYTGMLEYKAWANQGLHAVLVKSGPDLDAFSRGVVMQLVDHMYVVDDIFHHHLTGQRHGYEAARSTDPIEVEDLFARVRTLDDWYVRYSASLDPADLSEPLHIAFTGGESKSMTRGEILSHIVMHGTYHRGGVGFILQKNGAQPNDDRVTDFLASRSS